MGERFEDGFSGRVAVVTGGGTGMGRELVRQLTADGCDVATCDVIAENTLGGMVYSSPAVSGGSLYFRTDRHLVRIAESADRAPRAP